MDDAEPTSSDADAARADPAPSPSPPNTGVPVLGIKDSEVGNTRFRVGGEIASAPERRIDWREVRRVYELGADSVPAIIERFGLKPYQLRKVREAENWTTRRPAAKPGPLQGHKPVGADALDFRLHRLVAIGTGMLEQKVAEQGMTEANARTLRELCRAQEIRMRSTRSEKAAKAREKKNNDAGHDFRDDPAWLRAELTRRLEHLTRGGADSGASPRGRVDEGAEEVSGGLAERKHGAA